MASYRGLVGSGLVISLFSCAPCWAQSQVPMGTFVIPLNTPKAEIQSVPDWSKQTLGLVSSIWTEGNETARQKKLFEWAEQTPAQLAYVTRILQKNDVTQSGKVVVTLKDLFALVRRVNWQAGDQPYVQRIVATWSAIVPQLVKSIALPEISAGQRRNLEQALVDLVLISKDIQISTPVMRQTWQGQVTSLGQMSRHPKTSVRLTALSILEALGTDAAPAGQQVQLSLTDTDRFVRWAAVRTVQAIGVDNTTRQVLATLQKDEDASVRDAVQVALKMPGTADSVTQASRPVLDLSVPTQTVPVNKNVTAPQSVAMRAPENSLNGLLPPSVPTTSVAPAMIPTTLSQTPLPLPTSKNESKSEPVPLFAPPAMQTPVKQATESKNIQTMSNVAPAPVHTEPKVDLAAQWIPRLRQGTVDQQVQAVRELGKLGTGAASAVPSLAESLLKGNVAVRREIPLAFIKIGAPAKLANSVLERSLQDSDTDVKVNAATALLELADK